MANRGTVNPSRIVVLGEGLAAGISGFSLSADSQQFSFPAQMARQLGVPFDQPLFQPPGVGSVAGFPEQPVIVPSPLQSTVFQTLPPVEFQNLAVPGLTLSEALRLRPALPLIHRSSGKQTMVNLILGIQAIAYRTVDPFPTQLECAISRKPTLAIVQLGFAEAIQSALLGERAPLPAVVEFRRDYQSIVKHLQETGATLILSTIPNPCHTAYYSSLDHAAAIVKVSPALLSELWGLRPDDLLTVGGLSEIGSQIFRRAFGSASEPVIAPLPTGSSLSASLASRICVGVRALNQVIESIASTTGATLLDLYQLYEEIHRDGYDIGGRRIGGGYLGGFYSLNGWYPGATGQAIVASQTLAVLQRETGVSALPINLAAVAATDPVAQFRIPAGSNWKAMDFARHPPGTTGVPNHAAAPGLPLPQSMRPLAVALRLPPGLEQLLPINKAASYFGDALSALHCPTPESAKWGNGGHLLFGGLAMMNSHITGNLRIRFSPPEDHFTDFQISFEGGLSGADSNLAAPVFFSMPGRQQKITDVPGRISSGRLDLRTGEITAFTLYVAFSNSALIALVRVNPNFPTDPLSFPGAYGSAYPRFDQRPDGGLDFTFAGTTFVPLGPGSAFPLTFCSPELDFASVPASGTVLHPHLSLTTRDSVPTRAGSPLPVPENCLQEYSLYGAISSFGDLFKLHADQLGGPALGRSRLLGRIQIQYGPRAGTSIPIAVSLNGFGGVLAPLNPTPIAELFPGTMTPGPEGFGTYLRFPFRSYPLNDLFLTDDSFDLAVGALDAQTGQLIHPLLHRAFIHQDLIFALLRVEPRTPKDSFFFRGEGSLGRNADQRLIFKFFGEQHIPYPPGFRFPDPNMATGFETSGVSLDPYLWVWAIEDTDDADLSRAGEGKHVLSHRGELFSYRYFISGRKSVRASTFEYENHSQGGRFKMHSLTWIGFGNSGAGATGIDTVSFSGFGVWSQNNVQKIVQASVQISKAAKLPWVGIQIASADIGDVDTTVPPAVYPVPLSDPNP